MRRLALPVVLVATLAACGDDADTTPVTEATSGAAGSAAGSTVAPVTTDEPDATPPSFTASETTVRPAPGPGGPAAPSGPTGSRDERAAIADLAARRGVDEGAITVVSTEEVTWRDGSIGCPEPGVAYTQALVPGIRVILELDGVRYEYHAGGRRPIFLCEHPQPPLEG
jgi:hypothetical protein